NAIQHTSYGGEIHLSAEYQSAERAAGEDEERAEGTEHEDGVLLIEIADTGSGIEKSFLPHIFDRFATRPKRNSSKTGSGLGLSISKEMIMKHGGTLSVSSTVGVGSRFTITLPVKLAKEDFCGETE